MQVSSRAGVAGTKLEGCEVVARDGNIRAEVCSGNIILGDDKVSAVPIQLVAKMERRRNYWREGYQDPEDVALCVLSTLRCHDARWGQDMGRRRRLWSQGLSLLGGSGVTRMSQVACVTKEAALVWGRGLSPAEMPCLC